MTTSLACRCGALAEVTGFTVFDAAREAKDVGWVTHTIAHSDGRVVVIDLCPDCSRAPAAAEERGSEVAR